MIAGLFALLLGGLAAIAGGMSGGRSADRDEDPEAPNATTDPLDDDSPAPDADEVELPVTVPSEFPDLPDGAHDLTWDGLTAEEQLILELVNRARMDPAAEVARLNEALASGIPSGPVQPLAATPELSAAARAHSQDMDDRNFFAHVSPEGETPVDRALEEGHGSAFVGENIGAIGSTSTSFDRQLRAEAHHQNLWDSDGHQRNLMDGRWSEMGVGYDYGDHRFDDQPDTNFVGSSFVTEKFGDRDHSYLTGVVIEDGDGDDFYDIGEGLGGVHITAWDGTNTFATETWAAGGYSLRLADGTYSVLFEGGGLATPVSRTVTIAGQNVKLDVIEDSGTVAFASRLPEPAPAASDVLAFLPTIPMEEMPLPEEEEEEELLLA